MLGSEALHQGQSEDQNWDGQGNKPRKNKSKWKDWNEYNMSKSNLKKGKRRTITTLTAKA